jgi:hypothetical protein
MIRCLLTGLLLGFILPGLATEMSDSQREGRRLVRELLQQSPADNASLVGVLRVRPLKGKRLDIPIKCRIVLTPTNWQTIYETMPGTNFPSQHLTIVHNGLEPNRYLVNGEETRLATAPVPFANSDFWMADLALEFLHWPEQRALKKELRRSRSCTVLESVNPSPLNGNYARVVSWIDRETSGIVHAEAYDANGRKLKEFDPKEFKKVNGQWQLQEMRIRNLQSGSLTRLEFDLVDEPR